MITAIDSTLASAAFQQQFSGDATQQLQARFQELMAHGTPHSQGHPDDVGAIASKLVASQDAALQQIPNDMLYMMQNAQSVASQSPQQAMTQITQEGIYMSMEVTRTSMDLQMKMSLVSGAKDGLKTLLKNQ